MAKKNFVLDTNVILHDYQCVKNFQENNVYIPIAVLEEVDKFKKGYEQINYNARAFTRIVDKAIEEETEKDTKEKGSKLHDFITNGISVNADGGRVYILTEGQHHPKVQAAFGEDIKDHRILSTALTLMDEHPGEETVLVSKDVNMRLKALSLGLEAEDYTTDKIRQEDPNRPEQHEIEIADDSAVDSLYVAGGKGVPVEELSLPVTVVPNQTFVLKAPNSSALCRVDNEAKTIRTVEKKSYFGITPRNAEQALAFDVLMDQSLSLVALTGTAGTGKTLLALAAALAQAEDYRQILLARPIVSLADKDIGFLPGDYKQKIMPYMQPLFDNLNVIKSQLGSGSAAAQEIDAMRGDERLVVEALAYIRGRSLGDVIFIVDEAQNLTPQEIKTIITRAGDNARMIFTGDVQQIDSPYLDSRSNGLAYMIERMRGEDCFAHVNLIHGERSHLSDLAARKL